MPVSEPFEFWDMADGETREIRVTRWEEGNISIAPRYANAPSLKRVNCLRLHLADGIKETLPYYWDITSKHLIVGLKAYLTRPDGMGKTYTIKKIGSAPRARFSLQVTESE